MAAILISMPQANYRFEAWPREPKPPFEGGLTAGWMTFSLMVASATY
jgi:hypothetical protein